MKWLVDPRIGRLRRIVGKPRPVEGGRFVRVIFANDPELSDENNVPVLIPSADYNPELHNTDTGNVAKEVSAILGGING